MSAWLMNRGRPLAIGPHESTQIAVFRRAEIVSRRTIFEDLVIADLLAHLLNNATYEQRPILSASIRSVIRS